MDVLLFVCSKSKGRQVMEKIVIKQVAPQNADFRFFFEDDGMKRCGGPNCEVYIVPTSRSSGFNGKEYMRIVDSIEEFADYVDEYSGINAIKEAIEECFDVEYVFAGNLDDEKVKRIQELIRRTVVLDDVNEKAAARFLSVSTGAKWECKAFHGYSQGDYCDVVYCSDVYNEEAIDMIGKMWLGCGAEFIIDDYSGYYVTDDVLWNTEKLKANLLGAAADLCGAKPEDVEIYLYEGEHTVYDYKKLA